jgi:F0F1-type ATP synthase assembly protein I
VKEYGAVMGAVTEFVVTVIVFLLIGRKMDDHFATGSRYLVSGTVLGFVLGLIRLIKRLGPIMKDEGPSDKP